MRQTLFYLPTEILGLPLFGKGILFWAILLVGLCSVVRAVLQKRRIEDSIFYACITLLGLFIVGRVGPFIAEPQGFPIRGYGVCLTSAIILASALTIKRGKKMWNYPVDLLLAIVFVASFCGILGARLFYVFQYWADVKGANVRETLINIVNVTNGGLVVYGSIIGGIVSVILFLIVKRLPVLGTLDLFAPGLALGIAIGRIGCLMNGCCFGGPCDLPWGIVFPPESPAYAQQTNEGVISLYGITLAPPEQENAEKTLFSIKSKHVDLASEKFAPVFVANVDPGSKAEEAGIRPGAQICEMGLVPKGTFDSQKSSEPLNRKKIRRFAPQNNAQVFYFFLSMWNGNPDQDVFLTIMDPQEDKIQNETDGKESNKTSSEAAAKTPVKTRMRNVVFHPEPAKARPVHPTQIYSSINALIICCLLLWFARYVKKDGLVFAAFLLLYSTHRFCIELLRTDEESFCGTGLTVSQCVSVCTFLIGVAAAIYAFRRPSEKRALDGRFPKDSQDEPTQNAKA